MVDLTVKNILKLTLLFVLVFILANVTLTLLDKGIQKLFSHGCGCGGSESPCRCNGKGRKAPATPTPGTAVAQDLAKDIDDSEAGTIAGITANPYSSI